MEIAEQMKLYVNKLCRDVSRAKNLDEIRTSVEEFLRINHIPQFVPKAPKQYLAKFMALDLQASAEFIRIAALARDKQFFWQLGKALKGKTKGIDLVGVHQKLAQILNENPSMKAPAVVKELKDRYGITLMNEDVRKLKSDFKRNADQMRRQFRAIWEDAQRSVNKIGQ
jgi:hypothetical protein